MRDALAERVANGMWRPGSAIPNEGDLAREIGVSAGTVRKALELMEVQHLISRRQGRGTFVSDQTSNPARFSNLRGPDGDRLYGRVGSAEITEGAANEQECKRLRLSAGKVVYRIHRVRRHGDRKFLVEDATLPAALFPGLANKKDIAGNINALAQEYGVLLGKAEERISIGVASAAIADTLSVAPDTRVMLLDRLVFMIDGPAVEWRIAHCHLAGSYYLSEMS